MRMAALMEEEEKIQVEPSLESSYVLWRIPF